MKCGKVRKKNLDVVIQAHGSVIVISDVMSF